MEQSNRTFNGAEITDTDILNRLPESYRRLLKNENGFILFDGGLHVRGAVLSPEWHSLRKVWFDDLALHGLFPAITETDVPFAQDCLGNQFVLRSGLVHKLDAETGTLGNLQMDLEAFLNCARENPVEFLSLQPLQQFQFEGGELKPGQLLSVYPPFIFEESTKSVSLRAISMFDRIRFLSDFASQVVALAKGTKVRINVVNSPENEI
jgi:hypothetical protein